MTQDREGQDTQDTQDTQIGQGGPTVVVRARKSHLGFFCYDPECPISKAAVQFIHRNTLSKNHIRIFQKEGVIVEIKKPSKKKLAERNEAKKLKKESKKRLAAQEICQDSKLTFKATDSYQDIAKKLGCR